MSVSQRSWSLRVVMTMMCLVLVLPSVATSTPPYNLQCDHNFVGISRSQLRDLPHMYHYTTENPHPVLSWTISGTSGVRGSYQRAFKVQVSRGYDLSTMIWDSGVIPSEKQEIAYQGPLLIQGEVYLWNVTWWDQNGTPAYSEEVGHFLSVVGFSWDDVDWIASNSNQSNAQTFVKEVDLSGKDVAKAVLYVSGLGFYKAYVNGYDLHQMTDPPLFFLPGWTNYEFRIGYQAFVVTEFVKKNLTTVLKVSLAKGYRDLSVFTVKDDVSIDSDTVERLLRVVLKVDFIDGSKSVMIKSDNSWDVYTSKLLKSSIYNGEQYDARVAEKKVGAAMVTSGPAGIMYTPSIPNIVEVGYDMPQKIYNLNPNSTLTQIIDFGINTAGVINISVSDLPSGHQIEIRHAEVLTHAPYGASDGSLYTGNLRSAAQLDTYTANGMDKFYQPMFTYHGFRYVSVLNYPRKLTVADLKRVRVSTLLKRNSNFTTSNAILNQLQENAVVSHTSNLMTVPTDCDQRDERLGWMGDNGLSADAMAMNFHLESYFPHRVLIIRDDEFNGSIPEITPYYRYGNRPAESTWAGAYTQIPWVLMKHYGDTDTGMEFFKDMIKYIQFMMDELPGNTGISGITGRNGDWCQPPEYKKVNNNFTSAFGLLLSIKQLADIAHATGNHEQSDLLSQLFRSEGYLFNIAFSTNSTDSFTYLDDLQASYALPMYLDIAPNDVRISARLINIITEQCKKHLSTGIVGTKAILPVLSKLNQTALAVEIVSGVSYPSYGYMIHNPYEPATSLWELWNSFNGSATMDSRNHHMFSSVSGWMQTDMIGFQQVKGTYGYKEMDLYPASALDLSSASIELEYPKPIKYSWQRNGGLQCGKVAEDQSTRNPGLPKHDGLVIKCGEGVITSVVFASYGNPEGVCGYQRYGNCHATNSREIVEKMCLNKHECRVQADGDFWGDPCPGLVEVKWLTLAVQCSRGDGTSHRELLNRYSSLNVDVSIPIQSIAHVNIPAYGLDNLEVWDGNTLAYSNNRLQAAACTNGGIQSARWIPERDILRLSIISGDYSFTVRGQAPNETNTVTVDGNTASHALLRCTNNDNVISRIDWVSYGDPIIDEYGIPSLGDYHSHASQMIVENMCLAKKTCSIPMDKDLFFVGSRRNLHAEKRSWRLVMKFSCNQRV